VLPSNIAKLPDGRARQRLEKQEHGRASMLARRWSTRSESSSVSSGSRRCFRGLAKNTAHVVTPFAPLNLTCRRCSRTGYAAPPRLADLVHLKAQGLHAFADVVFACRVYGVLEVRTRIAKRHRTHGPRCRLQPVRERRDATSVASLPVHCACHEVCF
jgi:hypothetical protein